MQCREVPTPESWDVVVTYIELYCGVSHFRDKRLNSSFLAVPFKVRRLLAVPLDLKFWI